MATSSPTEPAYKAIARRKQAELVTRIPAQWKLPAQYLPKSDSTTTQKVIDVPRKCGLLSKKELDITENYSAQKLIQSMISSKLKAVEVTEAFCKRAAISHQLTLSITEPLFDSAIERAKSLDSHLARTNRPIGPLHGLPISLKDCWDVKGVDSSIGLAALCFKPAKANAPLVDLLLSLGCVPIAKTNIPQTLGALDSVNNVFGRTINPWNSLVTAGGSSGGEGVLIAMRGAVVGWGTDIGGSIRVPAMNNAVYGFKPSVGRIPWGGQTNGVAPGNPKVGLQAVGGPIAGSVADIDTVMREVVPRASLYGEDCIPASWPRYITGGSGEGKFVIGIMKCDGLCQPLPPVEKVIDEVAAALKKNVAVEVVEVPTPPAWTRCQRVANDLMAAGGNEVMTDLLESTGEPLIPWLKTRFKRAPPRALAKVREAHAQRMQIEQEMLKVWNIDVDGVRRRRIDALICPVAPHPVPELDRWNAVGYCSSFILLDYPAASMPVRFFNEGDLELGKEMGGKVLGSWDKVNREMWDEKTVDRKVYLGTPLCIQVVTPRLEDRKLLQALQVIDKTIHASGPAPKL